MYQDLALLLEKSTIISTNRKMLRTVPLAQYLQSSQLEKTAPLALILHPKRIQTKLTKRRALLDRILLLGKLLSPAITTIKNAAFPDQTHLPKQDYNRKSERVCRVLPLQLRRERQVFPGPDQVLDPALVIELIIIIARRNSPKNCGVINQRITGTAITIEMAIKEAITTIEIIIETTIRATTTEEDSTTEEEDMIEIKVVTEAISEAVVVDAEATITISTEIATEIITSIEMEIITASTIITAITTVTAIITITTIAGTITTVTTMMERIIITARSSTCPLLTTNPTTTWTIDSFTLCYNI